MLAEHPAYVAPDCPTRQLVAFLGKPESRHSWSKPDSMAMAIHEVVSREKAIPIRFPLGKDSWAVLRREVTAVAKDFDDIKELSESIDTVGQTTSLA